MQNYVLTQFPFPFLFPPACSSGHGLKSRSGPGLSSSAANHKNGDGTQPAVSQPQPIATGQSRHATSCLSVRNHSTATFASVSLCPTLKYVENDHDDFPQTKVTRQILSSAQIPKIFSACSYFLVKHIYVQI